MASKDWVKTESASALAARIRKKQISPVEVMDQAIARIEAINPKINALIIMHLDQARDAAKKAEKALMKKGAKLGSLHGVPVAMKDCFDFKPGWVCTFGGVKALKNWTADFYCPWAQRMEEAGAIIVGKTNSPIFGFRGATDNYMYGPSRNPFDLSKNTGGSSGGSAGAVAAGILPLCEGTDGGGSIRIPCSWSGVYGYKASFGRVPMVTRPDAFSGIIPFIFEGPITRTVADSALAMSVLQGYDSRDPFAIEGSVNFAGALKASIKGKKIAYTRNYGAFPVDPKITAVTDKAVQAFKEAGAKVEEVKIDLKHSHDELSEMWCRLVAPKQTVVLENFKKQGIDILRDHHNDMPPEFWHYDDIGRSMKATEFYADQEMRSDVFDAIRAVFEKYDFLVSPTLAALAVDNATDGNTVGPAEINAQKINRLIGWCMTYLINFTGNPAASCPAGLASNGLPVGLQIVGRRYDDFGVIAASVAFEKVRPWIDTYKNIKV
jgi:amidase/aspartyl-tRNA(Asn)/glutamyl-tRNA(Gln) amidotransferase subunit A